MCCVYIYSRVIAIREQVRVMEHLRYVVVVLVGDSANGENKLLKWPLWFAKISRLVPKYSFALGRSVSFYFIVFFIPHGAKKDYIILYLYIFKILYY